MVVNFCGIIVFSHDLRMLVIVYSMKKKTETIVEDDQEPWEHYSYAFLDHILCVWDQNVYMTYY